MPDLTSQPASSEPSYPRELDSAWKITLRWILWIAFLLFIFAGLAFVYYLGFLLATGSQTPTANQSAVLHQYGTVYITPTQQRWFDWLRALLIIGGLSFFAFGFVIQHAFGVKLQGPVTLSLPTETVAWKKGVRKVFGYALIFLLAVAALSFCYFTFLMFTGSKAPTLFATEALVSHGQIVYITLFEKQLLNWLWLLFAAGMPGLGVAAVLFHFVWGVRLFSKTALK